MKGILKMKRRILICMLAMSALLCSCAEVTDDVKINEISQTTAEQSAASDTETEQSAATAEASETVTEKETETRTETEPEIAAETEISAPDETELRALLDENLYCMMKIFCMGGLPHEDEPVMGESVYKVSSDKFATLSDLESYLLTVYTAEYTDMLLNDFPYEDTSMYLDVDGELCIDINYAGAKGYYVDWSSPEITVNSSDGSRCEFTIKCRVEEPADVPVYTDYFVDGTAVYENGRWVLEKMLA